MTQGFLPAVRQSPPPVVDADIIVAAPPELAGPTAPGLLTRLLPVVMSAATLGVMAILVFSRSGMTRNPMFLVFPMMMAVSTLLAVIAGRGQRQGRGIQ